MRTVFFDIDTQIDFVFPAGALYVPGAEQILPKIAELNRHAASGNHWLISTADAHIEDDPEFRSWKPHCVAGTVGQQKAASTLVRRVVTVPTSSSTVEYSQDSQIIIEKQKLDCFTNPNLMPLLETLHAERYVVYGVVSEYCVQCAAMGLLELHGRVELVTDAIQSLDAEAQKHLFELFQSRGGLLTTTAKVTGAV